MVPRNTLFGDKILRHALFSFKGSDEKTFFLSEPAKAVSSSGPGGCQTANGIKATKGSDYAGLTLD